jgi:hypothetical protein
MVRHAMEWIQIGSNRPQLVSRTHEEIVQDVNALDGRC